MEYYYKVNAKGYDPAYFDNKYAASNLYKVLLHMVESGKIHFVSIQEVKRTQYIKDFFRFHNVQLLSRF